MPSFTPSAEVRREHPIDRRDERGHVLGRFGEPVRSPRGAPSTRRGCRTRRPTIAAAVRAARGLGVVRRPRGRGSRSASSRRMRLRSALTSGEVPTPSSRMIARAAGSATRQSTYAVTPTSVRFASGSACGKLVAHVVEQPAQRRLQRAVHRVFAVVEERVERGATRARAADDVFDRRVVIAARPRTRRSRPARVGDVDRRVAPRPTGRDSAARSGIVQRTLRARARA